MKTLGTVCCPVSFSRVFCSCDPSAPEKGTSEKGTSSRHRQYTLGKKQVCTSFHDIDILNKFIMFNHKVWMCTAGVDH